MLPHLNPGASSTAVGLPFFKFPLVSGTGDCWRLVFPVMTEMKKALSILAFSVSLGRNFQLCLAAFWWTVLLWVLPWCHQSCLGRLTRGNTPNEEGWKASCFHHPQFHMLHLFQVLGYRAAIISGLREVCYKPSCLQQSSLRWCW